jgi:hypothetical protein
MKKFFTLLALAVLGVTSSVWADTYKITFNGQNEGDTDYFSWNSSKHNFNTKFNGCTYDGVTYKSGLKMEGATSVSWTSTAEATVTIVQSTWSANTIKLDGTELAVADAEDITGGRVYTITNVAAGDHSMTRGSGESGVFAIYVAYTGAVKTQLSAPEITFNTTSGEVTIGSVANATKVTYTTDGSTPTAESTEYDAPFDAVDGTVVKAIAIGDDVSYINSTVASETVLLSGITIATPIIKKFHGAVSISCASPNATIKYSIDGGVTYKTYVRPFTLTADANVQAYAERTSCTNSAEASIDVDIIDNTFTKTIYLDWNDFDNNDKNSATGKTGTVAEGYTLAITGNDSKKWSSNNFIITTPNGEKREWKVSNGAQNTLTIPAGVHVTKLTIYSIINSTDHSTICGWKEVGGVDYQTGDEDYKNVPMGSYSDVANYNTNPDVRVYAIDQTGGTITFTNAGTQLCFVIALDILEPSISVSVSEAGYATLYSSAALIIPEGVTAYTGEVDENKLKLTAVETTIPAKTAVVLKAAAGTYTFATTTSEKFEGKNDLAGGTGAVAEAGDLVLGIEDGVVGFYGYEGTLATNKAYLPAAKVASAPAIYFSFEDETEVTGVYNLRVEEKANAVFDLTGRRANGKGLMIQKGKVVLVK